MSVCPDNKRSMATPSCPGSSYITHYQPYRSQGPELADVAAITRLYAISRAKFRLLTALLSGNYAPHSNYRPIFPYSGDRPGTGCTRGTCRPGPPAPPSRNTRHETSRPLPPHCTGFGSTSGVGVYCTHPVVASGRTNASGLWSHGRQSASAEITERVVCAQSGADA